MRALLDPTSSYSAWASRAQRRTRGAHSGRRANHCCRARRFGASWRSNWAQRLASIQMWIGIRPWSPGSGICAAAGKSCIRRRTRPKP